MSERPIVVLESPYAGDGPSACAQNILYGRDALRDSILRGEAPFASHLLYTQPGVLDDRDPAERELGIELGLEFLRFAQQTVAYVDRGISQGMVRGIQRAAACGVSVVFRSMRKDFNLPHFHGLLGEVPPPGVGVRGWRFEGAR